MTGRPTTLPAICPQICRKSGSKSLRKRFLLHSAGHACGFAASEEITSITLVATKTCPNCKMAVRFLTDANIKFTEIFADEHPDIVSRYDITSAPTLLIPGSDGVTKIINASNINAFAKEHAEP